MAKENSSIETTTTEEGIPLRRNVDIGIFLADLEKAASEDTYYEARLYTIPEYVREIIAQFLKIRNWQRENDMPLLLPEDISAALISGDITIHTLK